MAFEFFKKKEDKLELEIERLEVELGLTDPENDEYALIARNLETLYKIRENKYSATRVSADTVASIAGTVLSIFAVMHYEEAHVITSRAWGIAQNLVQKLRR